MDIKPNLIWQLLIVSVLSRFSQTEIIVIDINVI